MKKEQLTKLKPIKPSPWNSIPESKQERIYYLAGLIVYEIEEMEIEEILTDKEEFELAVDETCFTIFGFEGKKFNEPVSNLLLSYYKEEIEFI